MRNDITLPAAEMSDAELDAIAGGRRTYVVFLKDGTVVVIFVD